MTSFGNSGYTTRVNDHSAVFGDLSKNPKGSVYYVSQHKLGAVDSGGLPVVEGATIVTTVAHDSDNPGRYQIGVLNPKNLLCSLDFDAIKENYNIDFNEYKNITDQSPGVLTNVTPEIAEHILSRLDAAATTNYYALELKGFQGHAGSIYDAPSAGTSPSSVPKSVLSQ